MKNGPEILGYWVYSDMYSDYTDSRSVLFGGAGLLSREDLHHDQQVLDTLENLGVQNVKIKIVDKGALDCTIRARVEAAVYRSAGQSEQLPWGGAIR